jgi:hypothetical protein
MTTPTQESVKREKSVHRNTIDDWLIIIMVSIFLSLSGVLLYLILSKHLSFKSYY